MTAFEQYLSSDHEESMKVLEEAQQEAKNSHDLIDKRDSLSEEFGQVRLEVYQWEEMWRIAKMCHEFVQKISPTKQLGQEKPDEDVVEKDKKIEMKSDGKTGKELFNLGSLENLAGIN